MSTLLSGLIESAGGHPDKPALIDSSGRSVTFLELDSRSNQIAAALKALGVVPKDRVTLISANSIDAILLGWGVFKVGASLVWLDERKSSQEVVAIANHAEPRITVVADSTTLAGSKPSHGIRWRTLSLHEIVAGSLTADKETNLTAVRHDDIASIVYTSGSSGTPKGVCLTHENLGSVARSVITHMPISAQDSYLMLVPIHYVHGLMQLLVHVLAGATIHLSSGFHFPRVVSNHIRDARVTGFSGVPYHFNALIERGGILDMTLPDLRWVTSTGGSLAPKVIAKFRSAFPNVEFHIAYGQTECAPRATALAPAKVDLKPNSVGSPIPGVRVHILSEDGHELPVGETGEVVVQGPNVMQGYWRNPGATAIAIDPQGRLHTGDLGHFDEDGDLFLDGRVSDLIKSAGERISASHVESILLRHPDVIEAIAVGLPDSTYGEILVANLCLKAATGQAEIESMLEGLHSAFLSQETFARSPRLYLVWSMLPKLANSKIDRQSVAGAASGDTADNPNIVKVFRPGYSD